MYLRLLTALFALTALVLSAVPARADQTTPTGSIAIRGSLLAAHDQDPAAAPAAEGFGSVSILTPDGRTLTLADATLHGANYVWDDDNLLFGSYYIDTAGITAPDGYSFLRMSGGMETQRSGTRAQKHLARQARGPANTCRHVSGVAGP